MFTKLSRTLVFRDPIYGYIKVDYKIIEELIDTKEFQRLRRIRQLSGVSEVFPTAEHSRFTHSLGAYEVAREILEEAEGANTIAPYEQLLLLITALLHDIGHGPYSHAFESITSISHEEIGCNIIESSSTQINNVLTKYNVNPKDITSILMHKGVYHLLESLTSSQIDVDRMDYLARDAYFTGASYGQIDRQRLIRSMIIKNNKVYFRSSAVNSLENYIMARYHMYWQVYYHSAAKGYDLLLESLYRRIYDLYKNKDSKDLNAYDLINFMKDNSNLDSFLMLDDGYISGLIKQLVNSSDIVLRDLAKSLESRKLLKGVEYSENKEFCDKLKSKFKNNKYKKYYFYKITVSQIAYLNTKSLDSLNEIRIIKKDQSETSLEEYSKIISGLIRSGKKKQVRYYYKEIE